MENNGLIYDDAAGSGTYWTSLALDEIDRTGIRYDGFLSHAYQRESLAVSLEEGLAHQLNSVTKNNDLLLYVVFLAALDIALYKYTGHDERIIGVPAYASGKGKQQTFGPKVLPLKTSLRGELTVKQLLKETQRRLLDAYENQYADVEHILRQAHVCETVMDLTPVSLTMNRLHVRDDIDYICSSGKNELALCIHKDEDGSIEADFVYNAGLFEAGTIRLFAAKYVEIARQMITAPDQSIARIRLVHEEETNRILVDFNPAEVEYSEQKNTLPELFESQAETTPDRIALRFGDRQLTYRELNEQSNALARVLRANGVKPEAIVGVLLERSAELAVGLLGILKAGGAYVPIDPKHPKERIEFILQETGAQLLLSTRSLAGGISFGGTLLDAADPSLFAGDGGKLDVVANPHHLAYVVYTSGTTGTPKGVMVEHRTLSMTMLWERQEYGFTADDVTLVTTNYAFDGFVTALFTPLISGSSVILTSDEESANPYRIAEYLKRGAVTYYTSVPAIYLTILEYLRAEDTKHLKAVTLVGEELPVKAVEVTRQLNPDIEIINRYGPSENTVDTTILRQVQPGGSGGIPIGKPIPNTKVFIVDKHHDLVPIGVPGELCIGGDRLARGYWKQPELTREKFIDSPFEPGKKMYKTGDWAKWLPDGNIQFLGRIDNQVKVRGIRVELREIENRLLAHPDVREAVVLVRKNEQQENDLTAYFTGNPGVSASAVKAWLKKSLPDSMVPAHVIRLDRMPLTPNGKINRRALPEPDLRGSRGEEYAAPRNEIEALLADVWSDVLRVERIGIDEDFFDLGGHSLKGTILIGKLHKEMNVKLALKDLFLHPTIRELSGYIEAGRDFGHESAYETIEPCEAQEWCETSSAQKRMFMVQQIEKGTAYNMPAVCEVEGDFDAERIEAIFRALVSRHESLRTSFENRQGVIMQSIHDGLEFRMGIREENDRDIDTLIRDFIRPFDLGRAPLFRAELVHSRGRTYLMVDMHHIVSDGVSVRLLMREFEKLYNGGEPEPLRIQYKDFAAWQNKLLQSESMSRQEAYWLEQFKDEIPVLELPYDFARPAMQSFEGSCVSFSLNEAEAEQVRSIARETGSTTQMVLLSAFYILLAKYSGQEDIVIGSPTAGRPHPDLQGIMGMFVNTLALRNQVTGEKQYLQFLEEVKRNALEAYENESYPFEALLDKVQVMRDTSRNPLFDVVFNMNHADDEAEAAIRGLRLTPIPRESGLSKFDLTLNADENGRTIECSIEYSTKLFQAETISRMGRHYKHIVAQLGKDREVRLADIDLITEEEKREILEEINATKRDYPRDRTIHALFEEQAEKGPDRTAAVYGSRTITYRELNARANQLAAALRGKGVRPDTVVGIMVERSIEMLIGILGILKAGGAYLPIDPDYPAERSGYMLNDCDARILLVTGEAGDKLRFAGERLDIAAVSGTNGAAQDLPNPDTETSASHLAYVVYSSGSTGQPKGILAEHRNVVRLVKNTNYVELREGDRILQTGALVFDATTFEVWGALLNGLTLYLVPNETILSPAALERELAENRIAILWLSVALFNQLAQEKPELFRPLRYLIVGGEVLSTKHINLVRSRCPGVRILNVYGPTENTTFSTFYPIERDFDSDIPIGKPISNTTAYVVGKRGELLPKGIYGELVLGGDGVARGYLKLPEQTAEKFVPSPFAAGERLYRSGDIVRWLPDGSLEYLGRADTQVKIRGFRVELEEIRRKLTAHPSIKEAFVAARENEQRGKYLCAYVTVEGTLDKSAVRAYLKESLPEYMVPSYLKPLDSLPLTTNGKVDVRALPEISPDELAEGAYEAPGTPTEAKLAEIWQDVLGVSSVGIHDHFFDLGGHSLKAMILVSRIHQALDVEISVRQVFLTPTVASLADALEAAAEGGTYEALKRAEEREYYPLSSAQKRLYVLQQLEGAELSYNMPVALRLSGALDRERLEAALGALIARHEALRTSFTLVNGEPVQRVQSAAAYAISYEEANERVAAERIQAFLHPFDLSEAPLLRTSLVRLGEAEHLLLFDMHHIVSDGTSMGIFVHELTRLYAGEQLEPLRLQYRDYAVWQQAFKQSPAYGKQEAYWLERFAGELPVLNLPADHPRPAVRSFDGARLEFELDAALSAEVRELARASGATLYMVLLAAFSALLARLSGQEELIVGSPVAGRPHAELQGLLGMFVSTLAIRSAPAREKTFKQYVEEVKEITMSAYEHADYPFEELVEQVVQQRDISRNPIFDVMFALQNMEQFELSMAEVEVSSYELDNPVSKFDLSLFVSEQGDRLHCTLEYATALFEPGTIARWRDNFIVLLQHVVSDPEISLGKANLLGSQDLLCLQAWTNGPALQVPDLTLHELFQEQADRTPDRTALVFGEERLTYRELDRLSDRMALALQHDRIGTGSIVGLMAGRSPLMVISLLGILKAGAAFLAVDPSYPAERIAYMLEDSRVSCLLVDAAQTIGHLAYQGQVRIMEEMMSESGRSGAARRQVQNDSGQLAYIIYTSGTTGSPKGIMMKHSNLINLIMHQYEHTSIPFDKNVLQYSSYSFDVSYQEIFSTLLAGGTVYLIEEEMRQDPVALFRFVEERDIRAMLLPASFVKFVWNDPTYESVWPKSVQHLVAAGEALVVGPALRRYMREQGVTLHNHYGPSEAHVTTMYIMSPQGTILEQPPVGRPISNASIYIVDPFGQPQPVGVAGEVYVGGAGVGRGYLHKPELTREKFVPNPWSPGTLMYRTGDMARWLADGNIEYLGRIDHQVKIRGYRIELGEIEARLLGIEGIREAVVLVIPDDQGNNELCAYFAGDREFVLLELREALKTMLPDYMIPAYFVQLEELPVTSQSGKIDRKALPKPEGGIRTGAPYSAPRNETEAKLAGLWREVLGLENIGVHDNFFHMGGHSLKATVLTGKLHKQFNVEVPLKEIFRNPTIRELSAVIENGRENRYETIEPCGEQAYYATSSAQKRMYLVQQLEQGIAYNMPILCEIDGEADPDRIEAAFRALVRRHESLRTSFEDRDGEIVQVIHSGASFRLERSAQNGQKLESLIRRFVRPFDLGQAPLFRAELVKSGNAAYLFVDMHHIVSDGVSLDIVLNDFTELYNGKEPEPLRLQYKDYAAWQNKLVQSEEMKRQEAYWTERFAGEIPVLLLPYDYGRPAAQSFEGDLGHFALDERLTEGIRGIARETGSTTHMVMLSLFHILLAKYSGQDDIVIGSPIAGRPHADLQNIVGMFVNTLALRNQAAGEKSYREFLKEVRDHALEAYENQSYPFETLLDNIQVQRDPGRNPLFDVMFNMSHLKEGTDGKLAGLRLKPIPREHRISKFDLTLHVMENEQAFACSFEYCTRLFHAGTIARMGLHYRQIAAQVCADREVRLADIDLITEEEKREILEEINATKRDYPRDRTIHALFEEQAEKGPDRIAAVYGSRTITYRELNARANQLAAALRGKGVWPDTVVGIMVERSIEMLIGILGILKAGGAYLPIDPDYPAERSGYMLNDCDARILLVTGEAADKLRFAGERLDIAAVSGTNGAAQDLPNPDTETSPSHLAYVVYSSGSTGQPKGILAEHRNVVRLVKNTNYVELREGDRILQTGALVFDATTFEVWGALLNGLTLYLVPNETILSPAALERELAENRIAILWLSVALFNQLAQEKPELFRPLRYLIVGGEVLSTKHINLVRSRCPGVRILNVYGPTENTTFSTFYPIERDFDSDIPIGKPISNTTAYVVGKRGELLPKGIYGELVLGGDGVARGYLNLSEQTAEKFVPSPFAAGERLYRSGDIVRWLPDGNLEYLGRADTQVKIRGFRVELEEIRRKLTAHPSIKEAFVAARENEQRGKYLCAYVTVEGTLDKSAVRAYLKESLPEYMVPSYLKPLDSLPLTTNGKVDVRALPDISPDELAEGAYEAPGTPTEAKLAEIWQDVLGVSTIGIDDHFFEAGGNSLSLIKLLSRIKSAFGVALELHSLYKHPTIRLAAQYIVTEEYRRASEEDGIYLLNEQKEAHIFAFPPIAGLGIVYSELAQAIGSHSLYAFDFIESDDRIDRYVSLMTSKQQEGPYVLFGYSAGGNLAFEVAAELARRGLEVSDLILLDSYKFDNAVVRIQSADTANVYQDILEEAGTHPLYRKLFETGDFKDKVKHKIEAYSHYLNGLANDEVIGTNIHFIEAEKAGEAPRAENPAVVPIAWSDYTTKRYTRYQGFGKHGEMLAPGYLHSNAAVLTNILQQTRNITVV